EAALALSDCQVKIPMRGMTQSLNVSVACAIVLFEAMRQREAAGLYGSRRLEEELTARQRFEWLHPAVTRFCRERGLDYPELDEEGNVVGTFPRS
ncbi:MAG: tRNA (guanosine(18)-2'-O)-methyltransferase TrmH, partial [Gammaproteobacteria bacterium]|nr:tRNA (guanosine(18)-2'-O)-methyltransferase TrmH [Gammaproteobacteria bacterium]